MKKISTPVDLCLYYPASRGAQEADCHTRKWSSLIADERYVAVRTYADESYWAVARAKCDCPDVKDMEGGVGVLWNNQGRTLFVKILPDSMVNFSIGADSSGPLPLQTVVNHELLEDTFFKLGRYVSGRKESECFPRQPKVWPPGDPSSEAKVGEGVPELPTPACRTET